VKEELPSFKRSLYGCDLGRLKIIAELWGIDFNAPNVRAGLAELETIIVQKEKLEKVLADLPYAAREALSELVSREGKMVWARFIRKYGELREMGPAKRDRLKPYSDEFTTNSEALWYRGLIAKAFFDSDDDGPLEFAYVPREFMDLLPHPQEPTQQLVMRLATSNELGTPFLADDSLVDDACTFLSGIRAGLSFEEMITSMKLIDDIQKPYPPTISNLELLLMSSGLINDNGTLNLENVRQFLESDRENAYIFLINAWRQSNIFNELRLLPDLILEGEWKNNPLKTRDTLLERLLTALDEYSSSDENNPFWSLQAFVEGIHNSIPDFQRTGGEYDAWYIRRKGSEVILKGYEHWDSVEGSLIRFIVTGVMHWLGLIDITVSLDPGSDDNLTPTAFRFSVRGINYFLGRRNPPNSIEDVEIHVRSNAQVHVHENIPLTQRYQVARFCEWEGYRNGIYHYRITPHSLERAKQQGLSPSQLLLLLNRYSVGVPSNLERAIRRWESSGTQTHIEKHIVLRVRNPRILKALQDTTAARFLGEPLGNSAILVKRNAWQKVQEALAELGYLSEVDIGDFKTEE